MRYKNLIFSSLKIRVLLWFVGITSIVLFLFSFSFYYFVEESISLRIQTNLYHKAIFVKENIVDNKLYKKRIDYKSLDGLEVAIIRDDKILKQTKSFTLNDYQSYLDDDKIFFLNRINSDRVNAIYILKFDKPFNGALIVYKKGLDNKFEDIEDTLVVLNPILLLLLIIIGSKLIDKILIPIKKITKTTKDITINNFSHTIDIPKNNDEIKELIDSFNSMIFRLKEGVDTLDRFNNDVSHELKTPLTVIQGELEVTLRKKRDVNYYEKSIKTALHQTKNIEKLINSLLLITKYSKDNIQKTFSLYNLDSMLMGVINSYQKELDDKNIKLHINKLESIKMKANQILIHSIFNNLLDNAIKYTPENKNIYISLYKENKIYFIIQDDGIGIPQDKIDKITDRFYRVDESRNKGGQ